MAGHNTEHHLPPKVRAALAEAGFIFNRRNKHLVYKHASGMILTLPYTSGSTFNDKKALGLIRRSVRQLQHGK